MSAMRGMRGLAGLLLLAPLAVNAQTPPAAHQAVRQAMQQGASAMAAGNFVQAREAFADVTKMEPAFAEAYLNLGLAEERAGQLDEARAALEKAAQLKPALRGPNLFLGIIAYRENRFQDAEAGFLRETKIDPQNPKVFMWLGVCRLAQDDAQGAVAPLDKAYALAPQDVDILYHRGRAYMLVANANYAAMFKLDRDSMRVHQVLAESDALAFRNQDAVNEFELAVKMAPQQPGLHEELGNQYWILGQMDKAAASYREELRIDPRAVSARYKLGSLLVLNQGAEEGVGILKQVLREDPSLVDAHYYLATGLTALERDEDAIREYEQAIAADPAADRAMSSYYKLAQAYRKLHRTQEAQAALVNFQQLRARNRARVEQKAAQIVRKRTELPVDDPEQAALSSEQGAP